MFQLFKRDLTIVVLVLKKLLGMTFFAHITKRLSFCSILINYECVKFCFKFSPFFEIVLKFRTTKEYFSSIWFDSGCFGLVRSGLVRFGVVCPVQCGLIRSGPVRFGFVRFGSVWSGSFWFNAVQFGLLWFNSVQCCSNRSDPIQFGSVWSGSVQFSSIKDF